MRRGGHGAAVDVLINSAGIFDDKPLEQVTADDLRRMYEVNVIGLFITTQAVLARMPDGGRIINISSRACLGFWGAVDFRQAGRLPEPLRLVQELAIAVYAAGQHILGWFLGLASISYHALVYAQGSRLLKRSHRIQPAPP
jgi:NAD(P)-dependent dehydrogenase (short-subunit alcohol dehydrogenase family)